MKEMDERLAAILALQRRLDRWRRGWHRQHKKQLEKLARKGAKSVGVGGVENEISGNRIQNRMD